MDCITVSKPCRACLGCVESEDIDNKYIDMFMFCTSIKILGDENVSACFCNKCSSQLVECYEFIKKCLKTDAELRELHSYDIPVLKSVKNEKEQFSDDDVGSNFYDDVYKSDNDTDLEFKTDHDNCRLVEQEKIENHIRDDGRKHVKKKKVRKKLKSEVKIEWKNNCESRKKSHHCPVCEIPISQMKLLDCHIKKDHPEYKRYQCHICEKGFRYPASMRMHFTKHSSLKNYECDLCHKVYKFKGTLKSHIESHLFGMHKCDKCDKSFEHIQALKSHKLLHKGHKPHLCDTCGQGFALATNLKVHMRIHSGERPYKCPLCPYTASFYAAFRRHKLSHTKRERKPCTTCGKDFADPGSLKRHMRLHTGEMPYKCDYCEMGFIDGWKRRVHITRHHNIALVDIPHLAQNRNATKVIPDSDDDKK